MSDEFNLDLKVIQWRELVRNGRGGEISRDDMKLAVKALRGDRNVAQTVRETAKKEKASKPKPKDASALLADFAAESGGQSSLKLDEDEGKPQEGNS